MQTKTIAEQLAPLAQNIKATPAPVTPNTRGTVLEELALLIKEMPGLNVGELSELCPHIPKNSIYSAVNRLMTTGRVIGTMVERANYTSGPKKQYIYTPGDGTPRVVRVQSKAGHQGPTNAGLYAQIDALKDEVTTLRAWKADAIKRFPDLDVPPLVLEARKIVASMVDDQTQRDHILAGHRDTTVSVKAVVEALSRVG